MASKPDKPKVHPKPPSMTVKDPHNAPFVYFELATSFGNNGTIINVTLAANRHLLENDQVVSDIVAVATLRCNIIAAMALRKALDDALLLGAPAAGGGAKAN